MKRLDIKGSRGAEMQQEVTGFEEWMKIQSRAEGREFLWKISFRSWWFFFHGLLDLRRANFIRW